MKYKARLVNGQGCVFDTAEFNSIQAAKAWARNRGGKYKLRLDVDGATIKTISIGR